MVWLDSCTGEGWDCAGNVPEGAPKTRGKNPKQEEKNPKPQSRLILLQLLGFVLSEAKARAAPRAGKGPSTPGFRS